MYSALHTRVDQGFRGVCCNPTLRGLGALTPEDALNQAMQGESSPDFQKSSWLQAAVSEVSNGRFTITPAYQSTCTQFGQPNVNLFQTVGGLAIGTTGAGIGIAAAAHVITAATAGILGAATMGIGAIVGIVSVIFAHHHAAVQAEQQRYCASIAAANNSFDLIDKAVQAGTTTPDAAAGSLDEIANQFESYVSGSVGHDPCNANCESIVILKAIIAYRKSVYQSMVQLGIATSGDVAAQAAQLRAQASQAQASGDVATANALLTQASVLEQQHPTEVFGLSTGTLVAIGIGVALLWGMKG